MRKYRLLFIDVHKRQSKITDTFDCFSFRHYLENSPSNIQVIIFQYNKFTSEKKCLRVKVIITPWDALISVNPSRHYGYEISFKKLFPYAIYRKKILVFPSVCNLSWQEIFFVKKSFSVCVIFIFFLLFYSYSVNFTYNYSITFWKHMHDFRSFSWLTSGDKNTLFDDVSFYPLGSKK